MTETEEVVEEQESQEQQTPSEEYAALKEDFAQIIGRGFESFQEKAPGRQIGNVIMRLQGRYGIIVQTNRRGLIEVPQMSGIEMDNQGRNKKQRMFMGMNCSATTKKTAFGSVNLLRLGETTIKEFEANAGAYELVKRSIERAQQVGEEVQRKVDEEEYEHWDRMKTDKIYVSSSNWDTEDSLQVDQIFDLVTLAKQTLKTELGAKLSTCKVVFFSIVDTMEIADSNGTKIDLAVPRTGFSVQAKTAKDHTVVDSIRGTGRMSVLTRFEPDKTPEQVITEFSKQIAKRCIDMDRAQPVSILDGEAHVVLDGEVVGVLAHEVYGHTSEADIIIGNKRDKDVDLNLKSRLGGQVSENSAFNIIDDGNFEVKLGNVNVNHCYGALVVDEDGMASQRTPLVENGIQTLVLSSADTMNEVAHGLPSDLKERLLEHSLSGNLRSERFDKMPMIRMTSTFVLPDEKGPGSVKELAAMVPKSKKGVYIVSCQGGWVDTDTGNFQITGQLGYLIENGVVTDKPVKDVIIHGNIMKFGSKIKAIGSSETITKTSTGWCGKDGQWVPVEDGGPAMLIENVAVGEEQPSWVWTEAYQDYSRQMQEVACGKRKRGDVYFRFLDDAAEEKDETKEKSKKHSKLCMLVTGMPVDDEVKLLTGQHIITADYILGEDGKLEDS